MGSILCHLEICLAMKIYVALVAYEARRIGETAAGIHPHLSAIGKDNGITLPHGYINSIGVGGNVIRLIT